MSAHPAPRATRAIRAETAGSSSLALGPNQRGKAGGEVEASIPVMAMAHQRARGKVTRRTWPNLAATPLDQGDAGATGRGSRFSLARALRTDAWRQRYARGRWRPLGGWSARAVEPSAAGSVVALMHVVSLNVNGIGAAV